MNFKEGHDAEQRPLDGLKVENNHRSEGCGRQFSEFLTLRDGTQQIQQKEVAESLDQEDESYRRVSIISPEPPSSNEKQTDPGNEQGQTHTDSKSSLAVLKCATVTGDASAERELTQDNVLRYLKPRQAVNQTMKRPKSRNQDEMQIIVEEIEKCGVDKSLSKLNSILHSTGRQESRSQNAAGGLQVAGSHQSPNDAKSLMDGTLNLLGSVNDRDEELSC